jgi:dienelactone hydrolase
VPRRLVCALLLGVALRATPPAAWPPAELSSAFRPPAELVGDFGSYRSPLTFADGRPVRTAADWSVRRRELQTAWERCLGPWPERLERPRITFFESEDRGQGVIQHRIALEVARGVMQHAFLLLPAGAGPYPAVIVVFYAPEVSVGYDGPRPLTGQAAKFMSTGERGKDRDFALQLARRGFVTLALGTPGDDAYHPDLHGATCQPLAYHAAIASNALTALGSLREVDPRRIGIMGHSYGGKWALFASCFDERFACAVWSDPGIVFDEARGAVNYWEPWYLGWQPGPARRPGLVTPANPRTGPYRELVAEGRDLHEVHALMAPRPFLVSGGAEDTPARWRPLNHAIAVNRLLGYEDRVAMTNRDRHAPSPESNAQAFRFLAGWLQPRVASPDR